MTTRRAEPVTHLNLRKQGSLVIFDTTNAISGRVSSALIEGTGGPVRVRYYDATGTLRDWATAKTIAGADGVCELSEDDLSGVDRIAVQAPATAAAGTAAVAAVFNELEIV